MHKLLKRQLRKLERVYPDLEDRFQALLQMVSQTYEEADNERRKKDRSVSLMSEELLEAHQNNLQRSEAYLTGILENVVDGILIVEQGGKIVSINPQAEVIFGCSKEALLGKSPLLLFPEEEQAFFQQAWKQCEETGKFSMSGKTHSMGLQQSGQLVPLEFSISGIQLPEETLYLILCKDISERIEVQAALIQAKERAEEAVLAKARFLSNMSHEIRTPMNAVLGLTDLLMMENPRPDQLETLRILRFSGDNLLVIINDILDYSKIESGKVELEKMRYDWMSLFVRSKNPLRPKPRRKRWNSQLERSSGVPGVLLTDPVRLSQILNNLISNAIKFTSEGKVCMRISEEERDSAEIVLRFEIEDSGIGIEAEQLDNIFESFTQSNLSTTREYGGTGLGLAISKNLVEIFGGQLAVRSEVGVGTVFWFEITVEYRDTAPSPVAQPPAARHEKHISLNGIRVLLVEDNKVNQLVASKHLKKWDVEVSVANDGQEAVQMVQQRPYDLILMDLHMPVMDGFTATKAIRALPDQDVAHLPIIALTASAMLPIRRQVIASGMNDFVSKPFKPKDLYETILKFCFPEPAQP